MKRRLYLVLPARRAPSSPRSDRPTYLSRVCSALSTCNASCTSSQRTCCRPDTRVVLSFGQFRRGGWEGGAVAIKASLPAGIRARAEHLLHRERVLAERHVRSATLLSDSSKRHVQWNRISFMMFDYSALSIKSVRTGPHLDTTLFHRCE
jgi:hypothetical protein